MRKHIEKSQHFTRRALLLAGGKLMLLSVLGGRLYYLQTAESKKYKSMAEGNRVRIFPIVPKRGRMLDRNGNVLAMGERRYQVKYESVGDKQSDMIIQKVAVLLELDFNHQQKLLERLASLKFGQTLVIEDYVDWQKVAKVEVNIHELPGITVSSPEVRSYPYAEATAHLLGYMGAPSEEDIERDALYRYPDFRIGKTGLEKAQEDRLRGEAGMRQVEVNSHGAYVRELDIHKGKQGEDVTLTIDIDIQQYVVEKLAGKGGLVTEGGSAVLLDIRSGDVLAMASVPSYDNNQFIRGISADYWKDLTENPDTPFAFKPIALQYPPGSTFKTITALAALDAGVITTNTDFYCPGYYEFGGRKFHCWERGGHGHVNLKKAIAQSCNVYFYKLALRLGVNKMAAMARQFGLGEATGIDLPGEKSGIVPDKAWKRAERGKPWYNGETLNTAIGQGFLLVTPLQLAVMMARLASYGKKVSPNIVLDTSLEKYELVRLDNQEKVLLPGRKREFEQIEVHPWHIRSVLKGMEAVMNEEYGGGWHSRIKNPEYKMAGKTGTAQVLSNKTFKYVPKNKDERYHALFIGYAPVSDPRYAVSVVIEHGGYGSTIATPIARDILWKAQKMEVGR